MCLRRIRLPRPASLHLACCPIYNLKWRFYLPALGLALLHVPLRHEPPLQSQREHGEPDATSDNSTDVHRYNLPMTTHRYNLPQVLLCSLPHCARVGHPHHCPISPRYSSKLPQAQDYPRTKPSKVEIFKLCKSLAGSRVLVIYQCDTISWRANQNLKFIWSYPVAFGSLTLPFLFP